MRLCPNCGANYEAPAVYCQRDGAQLRIEQEARDPYLGTKILGQFRLEKVVGSGGMGVVYGGYDEGLGRRVAVKILHKDLVTNRDVVARFHREAQIAHQLDHPNIVRLILFGQLPDGNLYLVLEYLEGPTLLTAIEREVAFAPARAVKVCAAISDAIGYAHRRDIIHRDLKPENIILIDRDGDPDHPKVLDFGIAKMLVGGDTLVTQAGLIFGTARYISPEGAQGDVVDRRSDVYSLGVIAYQALSGRTPFDSQEPVQLLLKHIHEPPPLLRSLPACKNVPPALEAVVMRALAKNPAARYGDGSAFARALREALAESDPQSAIRSVVPTAAMPMYVGGAAPAIAPAPVQAAPGPSREGDSGVRPHPAPHAPAMATLFGGSMSPVQASSPSPSPSGAAHSHSGVASRGDPAFAATSAMPASAFPAAAAHVYGAAPAAGPVAMPAVQLSALNLPASTAPTKPARAFAPVADAAAAPSEFPKPARAKPTPYAPAAPDDSHTTPIHPVDADDDIDIPGLPKRRAKGARGAGGASPRTVRTVVVSMAITVLVGAGAAWALGLLPSQRRDSERDSQVHDLLVRATEALDAGRYSHEQSAAHANDDVEDLTDAALVLARDNVRARQIRNAAAIHLRNDAVQLRNDGHPDRALPLLRSATRLADDDAELEQLIHTIEAEAAGPAAPAAAPSATPPGARPSREPPRNTGATRPHPTAHQPEPPPINNGPVLAQPTGGPTFTPGRDPSQQPPPPQVVQQPPPPVVQQPVFQQPPPPVFQPPDNPPQVQPPDPGGTDPNGGTAF